MRDTAQKYNFTKPPHNHRLAAALGRSAREASAAYLAAGSADAPSCATSHAASAASTRIPAQRQLNVKCRGRQLP